MSKLPRAVEETLRFITENQQLAGFSGMLTPDLVKKVMRLHREGKLKRRKPIHRFEHGLTASKASDCLVVKGRLPDGKYVTMEIRGSRVTVRFFGSPGYRKPQA